MRAIKSFIMFTTAAVFVSITLSCGSKTEPKDDEKPTGVIPEHQLKALDDARKTEDVLKKSFEDRNKQLEEDGG